MTDEPIETTAVVEEDRSTDPPTITIPVLQERHRELLGEEARLRAQLEVTHGARQDVEFWVAFLEGKIIRTPSEDT